MWRWSQASTSWTCRSFVFSTYVEVILVPSLFYAAPESILHVCGGDPIQNGSFHDMFMYSPRMWRWSWVTELFHFCFSVFSTYVEVILISRSRNSRNWGILHVCGGDPISNWSKRTGKRYSPRMWRWSCFQSISKLASWVFSTYVEVILVHIWGADHTCGILHVCGGDPSLRAITDDPRMYSPRMWRWSHKSN